MLANEQKAELIKNLRGRSVAKANHADEYRGCLERAQRTEYHIPTSAGVDAVCYVFTAKNREPSCRVHINVHGGGFVRPHFERDEIYSAKIADAIRGIVVDVDYALAPEYPYPAALHQCYDVCRWVFSMLEDWDGDIRRVSMGGHSAGASLTAGVALRANETKDFALCLQVLDYGCFDMATDPADKPGAATNMIPIDRSRMFTLAYTDGEPEKVKNDPYCNLLSAPEEMLKGLPPSLVISAGRDMFRFEDEQYASNMVAAGVLVTAKRFLDSDHGFIPHFYDEWEAAQDLIVRTILEASL